MWILKLSHNSQKARRILRVFFIQYEVMICYLKETDEKKAFHKQYFLLYGKLVITLEFRHVHSYATVIEVISLA